MINKRTTIKRLALAALLMSSAAGASAQSATTRTGTFDASGITEYSQYLYIGPGAHVTIPAGQQWIIASQYVFIDPTAVIDGDGQMIIDDPANFGTLSEAVAWAGQPATIDGGNSKLLVNVVNRNPNNIILGAVSIAASGGDITTANTDHTLYIGTSLTWAAAHGDATALKYNDVVLGNNDLKFAGAATEAGYTENGYAVTNGTGHVVKESYTGAWTFPVGFTESTASASDYTPASINNTIANGMHVLVQDYATSASVEAPVGTAGNGMQRTWNIYGDAAAGNSTIDLQHNSSTNQSAFSNASHFVTRWSAASPNHSGQTAFSNTPWESNDLAAGTATGTLTSGAAITGASERSLAYTSFATTASAQTAYYTKSSNPFFPLPIDLVRFDGSADKCAVHLSWETANEKNFDHFDVQYGTDGSSYQTIGSVQSKGNPQGSTYNYNTSQPSGTGMYRLQMVDKDGSYKLSKTLAIRTQCDDAGTAGWTLYPNPASGGVSLDLTATQPVSVRAVAIDVLGQKLLDQPLELQPGINHFPLPVNDWARGTYIITIFSKEGARYGDAQKLLLK